jgi:hypothetical protein
VELVVMVGPLLGRVTKLTRSTLGRPNAQVVRIE